ncbi:MAG: hypothetical protein ACLR13_01685 [Acutalibacteraceae bacterium]
MLLLEAAAVVAGVASSAAVVAEATIGIANVNTATAANAIT